MNITESFKICTFQKYADFTGKATRSEYWWYWLIYALILLGLPVIAFIVGDTYTAFGGSGVPISGYVIMILWTLGSLGLLCPFIAVSVRRLHDAGLSGWHCLWRFIPYIGSVITIFLMIKKSKIDNPTNEAPFTESPLINNNSKMIFDNLPKRSIKWTIKNERSFTQEEIDAVKNAVVIQSQYGKSVQFIMQEKDVAVDIPLDSSSVLNIGDAVDMSSAIVLTLEKTGESDIIRIKA